MQEVLTTGKARNIGVYNVKLLNLEKLLGHPSCKVMPAVNQIEVCRTNRSFIWG